MTASGKVELTDAEIVKVFHLSTQRNERTNWKGDTQLITRSIRENVANRSVYLSLDRAKVSAHIDRKPGTRFLLKEMPALAVTAGGKRFILTELFTNAPLHSRSKMFDKSRALTSDHDLALILGSEKWGVKFEADTTAALEPGHPPFRSLKSSPSNTRATHDWSGAEHDVNLDGLNFFKDRILESIDSKE